MVASTSDTDEDDDAIRERAERVSTANALAGAAAAAAAAAADETAAVRAREHQALARAAAEEARLQVRRCEFPVCAPHATHAFPNARPMRLMHFRMGPQPLVPLGEMRGMMCRGGVRVSGRVALASVVAVPAGESQDFVITLFTPTSVAADGTVTPCAEHRMTLRAAESSLALDTDGATSWQRPWEVQRADAAVMTQYWRRMCQPLLDRLSWAARGPEFSRVVHRRTRVFVPLYVRDIRICVSVWAAARDVCEPVFFACRYAKTARGLLRRGSTSREGSNFAAEASPPNVPQRQRRYDGRDAGDAATGPVPTASGAIRRGIDISVDAAAAGPPSGFQRRPGDSRDSGGADARPPALSPAGAAGAAAGDLRRAFMFVTVSLWDVDSFESELAPSLPRDVLAFCHDGSVAARARRGYDEEICAMVMGATGFDRVVIVAQCVPVGGGATLTAAARVRDFLHVPALRLRKTLFEGKMGAIAARVTAPGALNMLVEAPDGGAPARAGTPRRLVLFEGQPFPAWALTDSGTT